MFRLRFRSMNGIFAIEKPSGITSSKFIGDLQHIFTKSQVFLQDLNDMKNNTSKNLSTDKKWTKERIEKKVRNVKIKIGHGGTLDPLANGVLVIGVGNGTKKLQYYLGECDKTYETKALLGISTTTGDSEGEIITKNKIDHITKEMINDAAQKFVGDLKQTPPIFSALKMNGKPLYDYAREGKPLPMPIKHRDVKVHGIVVEDKNSLSKEHDFEKLESKLDENGNPKEHELANNPTLNDSPLFFSNQYLEKAKAENLPTNVNKAAVIESEDEHPKKLPLIHFVADVSSGTYIRSLVSDIGRALESSAYMVELKRSKQSDWILGENVFKMEDFTERDERVWGVALKEVLDKGSKVNLEEVFKIVTDKLQPIMDVEKAELEKERQLKEDSESLEPVKKRKIDEN